jgi:triacylglycerol lipase
MEQERSMPDNPLDLVAPELAPGLEFFPDLDFTAGIEAFRGPFDAALRPPLAPELESVRVDERFVPGLNDAPDVRVLHYTAPGGSTAPRAALLHIHGGGYVLGTPDINDGANRAWALKLGITVVSVDYRLAPETPWPGALEDCYAALVWMHDNADELGIDPARIAVAGESAGGGHAAALALYARDVARRNGGGPSICFQLLDAPMLDDRTGTASDPHPHVGHFVWTPAKNRFGWRSLLGVEPGSADVPEAAVPARAADLSGLPPTFVSVGALDLFLEEDMEFVRRLTRAGVAAELHVIPGAYHGFGLAQGAPQVAQLEALRRAALARALGLG